MKLFAEKGSYRANKILVVAELAGLEIEVPSFVLGKDNRSDEFRKSNPSGRIPALITDKGTVFESNAIARFVARVRNDKALYGRTFQETGVVDSWIEFCTHELEVPLCAWVYPKQGLLEESPATRKNAMEEVGNALTDLDRHLRGREWVVGDSVTLADVCLAVSMSDAYRLVFDEAFLTPFPEVLRWLRKCFDLPAFQKVLGNLKLGVKETANSGSEAAG
uniref:Glutathione transferase n=1 Tax=Chromera velia CCMP2878 TaxID=1169474 RepID=A0A0G4F5Z0_9ALVE|mmetsp:Transcript_24576/g.48231  ORF Transcript_24576/g.48231 Transcript_24576/m.48231 type:complete len:220 (+) Transcript_24576:239-898(+)|eukprot:Cvel_15240.t1-p1 / transcript=Cvel_15240.t1 / gene=Cvel_15240 / organism=Chromera_velia_CCMP2878 / gene_product=Probable elongation factor 1-gamma 1, putative / transcript_product=Probable elongation factor 1-gamma 1, putative / location=Cvel_scaffold1116:4149-7169(+) / protein_length=219 / sequence_SO=supercontig / SO=protein_coding / is_pseudo=false